MPAINDAIFSSLRAQGFSGAREDMLLAWLQANGATSSALTDAWREMLAAMGQTGQRNDAWHALLGDFGFTGALRDRELAFWTGGGYLIPYSLFNDGSAGVVYDASDETTLWQDIGLTPATAVDDPVGLWLDKSRGLQRGSEVVSNGTFDTDISDWSSNLPANISWDSSGRLMYDTPGGDNTRVDQTLTLVAGQLYELTFDLEMTAQTLRAEIDGSLVRSDALFLGSGSYTFWFFATSSSQTLRFRRQSAIGDTTGYIDNVSVKQIAGHHVQQGTGTAQPLVKEDGSGNRYVLFDGVDDELVSPSLYTWGADNATGVAAVHYADTTGLKYLVALGVAFGANTFTMGNNSNAAIATAKGSPAGAVIASKAAVLSSPLSVIQTAQGDVSDDLLRTRVNQSTWGTSATDQGTGNYGPKLLTLGGQNAGIFNLQMVAGVQDDTTLAAMESWADRALGLLP